MNLDGSEMDSMWHATKTGPSRVEMDALFSSSGLNPFNHGIIV